MRSSGLTKSGPPSRVTRSTKSTIDFLLAPSFQDGRGSRSAPLSGLPLRISKSQTTRIFTVRRMTEPPSPYLRSPMKDSECLRLSFRFRGRDGVLLAKAERVPRPQRRRDRRSKLRGLVAPACRVRAHLLAEIRQIVHGLFNERSRDRWEPVARNRHDTNLHLGLALEPRDLGHREKMPHRRRRRRARRGFHGPLNDPRPVRWRNHWYRAELVVENHPEAHFRHGQVRVSFLPQGRQAVIL